MKRVYVSSLNLQCFIGFANNRPISTWSVRLVTFDGTDKFKSYSKSLEGGQRRSFLRIYCSFRHHKWIRDTRWGNLLLSVLAVIFARKQGEVGEFRDFNFTWIWKRELASVRINLKKFISGCRPTGRADFVSNLALVSKKRLVEARHVIFGSEVVETKNHMISARSHISLTVHPKKWIKFHCNAHPTITVIHSSRLLNRPYTRVLFCFTSS